MKNFHLSLGLLAGATLAASMSLVGCAAPDASMDSYMDGDELADQDGEDDTAGHRIKGQALGTLEAPICDQRWATNMNPSGNTGQHPGGTMRLFDPGSALTFWLNPPVEQGTWTLKVSARAHGNGYGYPTMRLWNGNTVIGSQQVDNWPNLETYTFEIDVATTSTGHPITIEYTGASWSRDLIVEGVDILCPGVSCGQDVCTQGDVCCVPGLDPAVTLSCATEAECPFTSQARFSQMSCDSHADCESDELCVGVRFGNLEYAITCVDESSATPVNGSTIMVPVCGSPGREEDPCPAPWSSCQAPSDDELGLRTCGLPQ